MHPLNPYRTKKPDFTELAKTYPEFAPFVKTAEDGYVSIDFQDPAALRGLTRCLLMEDWGLDVDLREDRICPTITNRLDYLLNVLDLEPYLPSTSSERPLRVLDIGTGAVAIYPILLHQLRPTSQIFATELDETSFTHALSVLEKNHIGPTAITVFKSPCPEPLLFPIHADQEQWDLVICNPPFFGSEEEMRHGQELKERGSHAAPTAAANELITPGGEVAFVSRMIQESLDIGDRCGWYTSLIGKYSSLAPLIDLLHHHKIDNYLLKVIKQSKTSRWILGWSHGPIRVPDRLARPELVVPNTSFARLLPHANTYSHRPEPSIPLSTLRTSVLSVLGSIALDPSDGHATFVQGEEDALMVSPIANTWSRAARRQAARQAMDIDTETDQRLADNRDRSSSLAGPSRSSPIKPTASLFRAKIRFVPTQADQEESLGQLEMDWLEGRDRTAVEALWKYILTKAELVGKRNNEEEGLNEGYPSERRAKGRARDDFWGRSGGPGDGHWRGGRPRQRMRFE